MATVTNTVKLPDGSTPDRVDVVIELVASTTGRAAGWITATDVTLEATVRPTVTNGAWTASLTPNADITPSGSVYKVTEYVDKTRYTHYIEVGSGGGSLFDLLVDPPASLATAASELYADAAVAAHTGDATGAHAATAISRNATSALSGISVGAALDQIGTAATRAYSAFQPQQVNAAATALAPLVTQGLYVRTQPTPDTAGLPIRPLVADPDVAGRLWCVGSAFGQIGHTDNNGTSWTARTANPGSPMGVQGMYFAGSYVYLLLGGSAQQGQLWRSPKPAAAGTGLSWTKVFDLNGLANGPGGSAASGGDNSNFRNSCFAVSGSNAYLVEYSTTTITGGPSLYYSSNIDTATASNVVWTKPKTWSNGKHAHAVKIFGGVPWVTIGDATFTDLGLWTATSSSAATWNRRSGYGEINNGTYEYGINMQSWTVGGIGMVLMEYDGYGPSGPLVFPSQDPTKTLPVRPLCELPFPYMGSMRGLVITSEGNLMWATTSESGAIGTLGSIWVLGAPFTTPVLLESFTDTSSPLGTIGDPVESGDYVWFGTYRCRKEKFIGQ